MIVISDLRSELISNISGCKMYTKVEILLVFICAYNIFPLREFFFKIALYQRQ